MENINASQKRVRPEDWADVVKEHEYDYTSGNPAVYVGTYYKYLRSIQMWYKLDLSYDTKRWRGMQGDTKAGMKKIVSGLYQDCICEFLLYY